MAQRQAREESRILHLSATLSYLYEVQRRTDEPAWETIGKFAIFRDAQRALREWRERRVAELTCEAKP